VEEGTVHVRGVVLGDIAASIVDGGVKWPAAGTHPTIMATTCASSNPKRRRIMKR